MTVTSFGFLGLLAAGVAIYYCAPKKIQWIVLLGLSMVFYYYAAEPFTIIFLIISTATAYITTNLMPCASERIRKHISGIAVMGILINAVLWFALKGSSFWLAGARALQRLIPDLNIPVEGTLVSALGMGYYTAQVVGYILDCYRGVSIPQRNPIKLFLFVCFFPQLTVGPISKYSQLQSLYEGHRFSYSNLCFGSQRILWGFFKKLVISDRVGIIISAIWADAGTYTGFWPWCAVLLYPLQIYTDFSGCMDIVLGAAELFDIKLPENFHNPFTSRSVQEFWQRWHITLGIWAKDYVYYPVLKSKVLVSLGRWTKKHFGKRGAKLIPWAVGMGILWFVMGFWHGSMRHILGLSAWYWIILVLGELFAPVLKKLIQFLKVNTECYSWKLFQRIRTYVIFAFGTVFFAAPGFHAALERYKILYTSLKNLNPWIFFDGSILNLGVSWMDVNLVIIGTYLLVKVAYLRAHYGYARIWIQKQILPFRWLLWIVLFLLVLIYGLYGAGYDASQFIYQGF